MNKLLVALLVLILSGCTDNMRARNFGGSMKVDLKPGFKLVNVTWKDEQLWTLERETKDGEKPETFHFREKASFGMLEGEVVIVEHAK